MDTNTLDIVLNEYAGKGSEEDKQNIIENIIDIMNVEYEGEYDLEVTVKSRGITKTNLKSKYFEEKADSEWQKLLYIAKVLHWFAAVEPSKHIKDEALGDFFEHFYKADINTEIEIKSKNEKKKSKDGKKKKTEETKTWNLNPLVYAAAFNNPRVYKVLSDCDRFPRWHADENMIGNILEEAKKFCDECSKVCDPTEVNNALEEEGKKTTEDTEDIIGFLREANKTSIPRRGDKKKAPKTTKIPIKSRVSKSLHAHLKF